MLMVQQGCPNLSDTTARSIRALNQPASHAWPAHLSVPHGAEEGVR
ncbi:hypothetical protein [Dictyobacter aurantiacus]|uniref:Uncharacterized protein n=1 Tax=Dictyobacter aurantiacus TaxID=1936993 RepID=A0A401ZB70_9CHLR|nr:hypothetical protein [Dictyobacter aurantiacus]GCE04003.1 hypothetical protein KDAU_13320 [Dictyobacter aurantiacus]